MRVQAANNVLIVEDSNLCSGLITKKISLDFQFKCIVKHTYQEAVSRLEENSEQFLFAVLDLNLPDAPDGEIVSYVNSKSIPTIIMTSQVNDEIRDKIISLQIFDYITKGPQSLEVLSSSIRRYFRNVNFNIMLVDDSKLSREMTRDLLVSQYFHVIEASNGIEVSIGG